MGVSADPVCKVMVKYKYHHYGKGFFFGEIKLMDNNNGPATVDI